MPDIPLNQNQDIHQFSSEFKKPKNNEVRTREYLTEEEIGKLLLAAKKTSRYGHRNYCLVLTMFRHGLRATEASQLRWSDVDIKTARIHINRLKKGNPSTHPIYGDELRALKQLEKQRESSFVFESERSTHITDSGIRQIIFQLGNLAGFDFPIHPHMLRHSCGYYLANKGYDTRLIQDWLGHKNINCTVIYTQLSPNRFEGIFDN